MKVGRLILTLMSLGALTQVGAATSRSPSTAASSSYGQLASSATDAASANSERFLVAANTYFASRVYPATLAFDELNTRSRSDFAKATFRTAYLQTIDGPRASSQFVANALESARSPSIPPEADIFLMLLVLLGLVAFQLRRTQESLQRPFSSI